MIKSATKQVIKEANLMASKQGADTIRLWENYHDQAILWRAIALLQIPATAVSVIFAVVMYTHRSITLNVPAKPLPGMYAAQDIPDTEFIDMSTEFLNLIASYQYHTARRQFDEAARMLTEPALSRFNEDFLDAELKTVESTNRTQIFLVDPTKTQIDRSEARQITITMMGDRLKIIAGKELPLVKTKFTITLTTNPRNKLNPYGIVITDFSFENVEK